ncbi:MAG TPA: ribonuclease P protein component, partial [Gammaproteobacteria bacterium]|nr:ribonuclease P protein component [Gammaproteobacteria bacterium]
IERNRLKRVAREVFRLLEQPPSADFVVLAGPGARQASVAELRLSLQRHFERLAQPRGGGDHG